MGIGCYSQGSQVSNWLVVTRSSVLGVYVKVCVSQKNRGPVTKQTQVRKAITNWSFHETFVFSISPKIDHLTSTSIEVKVMQRERLRADVLLADSVFGAEFLCTSRNGFSYWCDIISNPDTLNIQWLDLYHV